MSLCKLIYHLDIPSPDLVLLWLIWFHWHNAWFSVFP
jgi:hypothetical protein